MAKGAFQTPVYIFGATRSGTGKSSVISNLGIFLHGRGGRVAFIDLNAAQPQQLKNSFPKSVTVDEYPDLSEIAGNASGRFRRTFFISNSDRLSLFTGYKIQDTALLLNDTSLKDFLLQIRSSFDHVLINLPYGIEGFNLFEAFSLTRATRERRPPVCIIVATPEIRTSTEIDYLLRKKPALRHVLSENLLVMFNKVSHKVEDQNIENLQLKLSDIKSVLQLPLTIGIPYLEDFKAQRSNPSALVLSPTSSIRQAIAGLARTLSDLSDGEIPWEKTALSDSFKPFVDPITFSRISPLILQVKATVANRLFISPDNIHAYAEKDGDLLKVRIRLTAKSIKTFSPLLSVEYRLVKPQNRESRESFPQLFAEKETFRIHFRERIRQPDISVKPVYHIDDRFASSVKFEISENLRFIYQLPVYGLASSFNHNHLMSEIPSLTQLLGFGKKKRPRISFAEMHFSFLEFYFTHFAIPPQFDFQTQFKCGFEPRFASNFHLAFPVRWLKLRLPMRRPSFIEKKLPKETPVVRDFVGFKWNIYKVRNEIIFTLPWKSSKPHLPVEHYFSAKKYLGISISRPVFFMHPEKTVSIGGREKPRFHLVSPGARILPSRAIDLSKGMEIPRVMIEPGYNTTIKLPVLYNLFWKEIRDLSTMKTVVQITDFHFPEMAIFFSKVSSQDELKKVSRVTSYFHSKFRNEKLPAYFMIRTILPASRNFEFSKLTLPYCFNLKARSSIETRGTMLIQREPSGLPHHLRLENFGLSWIEQRYDLFRSPPSMRQGISVLLSGFFRDIAQKSMKNEQLKPLLHPRNWEKFDAHKSILAFLPVKNARPEYSGNSKIDEQGFSFFHPGNADSKMKLIKVPEESSGETTPPAAPLEHPAEQAFSAASPGNLVRPEEFSEDRELPPLSKRLTISPRESYDPAADLVLKAVTFSTLQFNYFFPLKGDSDSPSNSLMGYCPPEAWIHSYVSPLCFLVGNNLLSISERKTSIVIRHGNIPELALAEKDPNLSMTPGFPVDLPPFHQRLPESPELLASRNIFQHAPPQQSEFKIESRKSAYFNVTCKTSDHEIAPVSGITIKRPPMFSRKFWNPPILPSRPDIEVKPLETIDMLYNNLIERGRIHFGFPNQFNAKHLLMKWVKKLRILTVFAVKYKSAFPVNFFVLNPFVGLTGGKFQRGKFSVRHSNVQDLLAAARRTNPVSPTSQAKGSLL